MIEASDAHFESLYETIQTLVETENDIDLKLTIKFQSISVDLNVSESLNDKKAHFYIFNTKDVERFDNISLPTYQISDNQKTSLLIRNDGTVLTEGKTYSYSCFNERFYNDWGALEKRDG